MAEPEHWPKALCPLWQHIQYKDKKKRRSNRTRPKRRSG